MNRVYLDTARLLTQVAPLVLVDDGDLLDVGSVPLQLGRDGGELPARAGCC